MLTSPYVVEAIGNPEVLHEGFLQTQLADDFSIWHDSFGLVFTAERSDSLTLPSYTGGLQLDSNALPRARDDAE